jgi:hypothetical protein
MARSEGAVRGGREVSSFARWTLIKERTADDNSEKARPSWPVHGVKPEGAAD